MKWILQIIVLGSLLGLTGCLVPVREERTRVRYEEHPRYYHHWEHRGDSPYRYHDHYYYDGR